MSQGIFEIVTTTTGAISIRNTVVNEIMHNPVGPWLEANALYIEQSHLKSRLQNSSDRSNFVLFDVGLGAGSNALAALTCAHQLGDASRPLHIVSFERDLDLLQFALDQAAHFPHFKGYEAAVQEILAKDKWTDGKHLWDLRRGEFPELIEAEPHQPHLIFFDPYSPDVNAEMWTTECFEKIFSKCRTAHEGGTVLYTYSMATRIRASLLFAGFHVGHGIATGLKSETTEAATNYADLRMPLIPAWYGRWQRSIARYSADSSEAEKLLMDTFMENYVRENKIEIPPRIPPNYKPKKK